MDYLILNDLVFNLYVLVLASLLGFEVISKVPTMLHTPLMSGSNAISGVILLGALVVASRENTLVGDWLSYGAIFLAMVNLVGGFAVTDRMLSMFKKRKPGA